MYPVFRDDARRLLAARDATITFLDVGSRNGIIELASIAQFVRAYGFEPNQEEYEKLVSGTTDASLVGVQMPAYRSTTFSPFALADRTGRLPLYITRSPGPVGLLEPDPERLREIRWKGATFLPNFAEEFFAVERVEEVEVTTLEAFARERRLDHIDYLKLDVEGSEYEVLAGVGSALLRRTGVIKAELCFIPFRKGQKLFSDVDLFLRKHGFDLLRYEIVPGQIGFKERTSGWSFGPVLGIPEQYGQPLQCDAIYVNREVRDPDRALAQGVILLEKRYLDEALFIFRTRAGVRDEAFLDRLRTYRGRWSHRALNAAVRGILGGRAFLHLPRTIRNWFGWRALRRRERERGR